MTSTEKSAAANALNACLAACERVIESQGVFEGIDFHALKKGVERGLASLSPADPGAVAKRLEFAFREGFNDAATFKDVETAWKLSTVAALASSPSSAPAESGWQPIETAPKGCNVLVGYWNRLGKWRTVKACYYPPQTLELHEDHDLDEDSDGYAPEGWYEETETHEVTLPLECDPARWMPLPAAPQAVQAGGEGGNG